MEKKFKLKKSKEKPNVPVFKNRLFVTKTRWGAYEILTEQQYEMKLIYG